MNVSKNRAECWQADLGAFLNASWMPIWTGIGSRFGIPSRTYAAVLGQISTLRQTDTAL